MDSDQTELTVALNRFIDRLDRMDRATNNAEVTVSAGGVGVWIAAFCAGLCFVMTMVLLVLYVDQSRKVDDLSHYLQAIYAQAPSLKPSDENDRE